MTKFQYIITGNKGFIGTNMCNLLAIQGETYYGIDAELAGSNNFTTIGTQNCVKQYKYDLCDTRLYDELKTDFNNNFSDVVIINYAAYSHVDLSIKTPVSLVTKNIQSTYTLAEFCAKHNIMMVNIGTDEIYGELDINEPAFTIHSLIHPRNPYSASKACAEVLLESLTSQYPNWKLIRTRCVNNFGEYQDYTKLIPVCIDCILNNKHIPIYGKGQQIRSWIDVNQHNKTVFELIQKQFNDTKIQGCYNIGSNYEFTNMQLVQNICNLMNVDYTSTIKFIEDPRGNAHDYRYSLDSCGTEEYLSHSLTQFNFNDRLLDTIEWYTHNLHNKQQMWKGSANV